MKVFLRWEIDLYLNYLHKVPFDIEKVVSAAAMLRAESVDITIDEFRRIYGMSDHPDLGSAPDRGAALIHATDSPQSGDDTIPQGIINAAKAELIASNAAIISGKLSDSALAAKYAALWAAAT